MGTFACILEYAEKPGGEDVKGYDGKFLDRAAKIEITILGIYVCEDLLTGSTRDFELAQSDTGARIRVTER